MKTQMRSEWTWVAIALSVALGGIGGGCGGDSPYPVEVAEALKAAGDNRPELERVLSHYAAGTDSLKLEATCYLIGNMEGHCFGTYTLCDTAGDAVEFNVRDYADYETLLAAFDSLETEFGVLEFEKGEKVYDIETIGAQFLIHHIDYAFRAWREKPWAIDITFDQFCQYVLPYRGSNEPLEQWRETFWEKYRAIEDNAADRADPVEVARLINDDLKSWFSFDARYYYHPTDQGASEMLEGCLGRCEDMTNLTIYAMRANGVAVTSDYTPHWANADNNHAWNAVVTHDGRVIPFMGAEANPGEYSLRHKPAKVYRKMFSKQKQNLAYQNRKQEKIPGWLAGKSYVDVTADYVDVADVTVTFGQAVPDSVDVAYLCVFNSGEWEAIHWGRIDGDSSVFRDMGTSIAYLPALYIDEEILPFGVPFILLPAGDVRELRSENQGVLSSQRVLATGPPKAQSGGPPEMSLTPGSKYELFYWDDDWQSLGESVADDKPPVFHDIPAGCLYWLVEEGSDHKERIFTIEDNWQVWW